MRKCMKHVFPRKKILSVGIELNFCTFRRIRRSLNRTPPFMANSPEPGFITSFMLFSYKLFQVRRFPYQSAVYRSFPSWSTLPSQIDRGLHPYRSGTRGIEKRIVFFLYDALVGKKEQIQPDTAGYGALVGLLHYQFCLLFLCPISVFGRVVEMKM